MKILPPQKEKQLVYTYYYNPSKLLDAFLTVISTHFCQLMCQIPWKSVIILASQTLVFMFLVTHSNSFLLQKSWATKSARSHSLILVIYPIEKCQYSSITKTVLFIFLVTHSNSFLLEKSWATKRDRSHSLILVIYPIEKCQYSSITKTVLFIFLVTHSNSFLLEKSWATKRDRSHSLIIALVSAIRLTSEPTRS